MSNSDSSGGNGRKKKKPSPAKPAFKHLPRGIYLIELDPSVIQDSAFRKANPRLIEGQPSFYFYCGSSSQRPRERYIQHITGGRNASRIAHRYGRALRMDLVPDAGQQMPRAQAIKAEARLARELRAKGYGVWQA
jgi:hypothetical protein